MCCHKYISVFICIVYSQEILVDWQCDFQTCILFKSVEWEVLNISFCLCSPVLLQTYNVFLDYIRETAMELLFYHISDVQDSK